MAWTSEQIIAQLRGLGIRSPMVGAACEHIEQLEARTKHAEHQLEHYRSVFSKAELDAIQQVERLQNELAALKKEIRRLTL